MNKYKHKVKEINNTHDDICYIYTHPLIVLNICGGKVGVYTWYT